MLVNPILQIAVELWGSIICFLFAAFIFIGKKKEDKSARYLLLMATEIAILLLSDSLAIYYRGNLSTTGYYVVRISNYICFCLNSIVELTAGAFLKSIIVDHDKSIIKSWYKLLFILCAAQIIVVTLSQWNGYVYYFDEQNRYHRGSGQMIPAIITFSMVVLLLYISLHNYKQIRSMQTNSFLLICSSSIIAEIFQVLFYGISLVYLCLAVGALILLLSYQREHVQKSHEIENKLLEKKLLVIQQQKELSEQSAKLMLSQIQPHFIFNTLAAISSLCVFDPESAKKTTDNFATYLRRNLDSLGNTSLIPFSQEMEHVKAYLAIEKVRFEDDLNVEYDIGFQHFKIPPLTLQPIVENAVRHGIRANEDGGTILIKTYLDETSIHIIVIDNGIGFDINSVLSDGKTHVGIQNVSERLKLLCNGTLEIQSEANTGTTVTIKLPITDL